MQSDPDARVLAGGTDLLIQFRAGLRQPSAFVDVKLIPELVQIAVREDGVRIGASAAAATICEHAALKQWWPGLVESVHLIGSTQIQGRASIGGNLCNASPAADSVCALIVNRAVCIIAGPGGERRVPVEEFCSAPGRTVLQPGELLIAVDLPRPQPGTSDAYLRAPRWISPSPARASASPSTTAGVAPPRAWQSARSRRPRCSFPRPARRSSAPPSTMTRWRAQRISRVRRRGRLTTSAAPPRTAGMSSACL
jgi:CO/xanthine dehydrogenase FAD-binding subunit